MKQRNDQLIGCAGELQAHWYRGGRVGQTKFSGKLRWRDGKGGRVKQERQRRQVAERHHRGDHMMLIDPVRADDVTWRNELIGIAARFTDRPVTGAFGRVLLHLLKGPERRLEHQNPEREDDQDDSQYSGM